MQGEACDDGDKNDDIGCKSDCTGEIPGWHCIGGSLTTEKTCSGECGDDYINDGEECEDGNLVNLDGCDAQCMKETGWTCLNTFDPDGDDSDCNPICGDGIVVQGEVCDDGTELDNKGCNSDCSGDELGYECLGGDLNFESDCKEVCGDGVITENENCEDGNNASGDGCSDKCLTETGFDCVTVGHSTTCKGTCGDGKMKDDEICDDGIPGDNKGCLPDCSGPIPGWECLGGDPGSPIKCDPICGDKILIEPEQCEDQIIDNLSGDGCSDTCMVETGWSCNTIYDNPSPPEDQSFCDPICNDGLVMPGEICDEGLIGDNKGCKEDCSGPEPGYDCSGGSSTGPSNCWEVCGDLVLTQAEECEDGNIVSGDGCSSSCKIEPDGWDCDTQIDYPSAPFVLSTCVGICGDGMVKPDEVCDDDEPADV